MHPRTNRAVKTALALLALVAASTAQAQAQEQEQLQQEVLLEFLADHNLQILLHHKVHQEFLSQQLSSQQDQQM